MSAARLLIRSSIFKNAGILSRAYGGGGGHHRVASHNDLPVPQGDWYEKNQKTQAKYNAQLGASALVFGAIIAYMYQSNVVDLNWSVPDSYE